jgi:4-amino-4-deoxy-L-arabinose transferase-like glycosyltransferase
MTDGPLVFFILASIYFMLRSEEKTGINRYAVLGGVFFGLALMTKQIQAMLIPLIIIVYFAVTKRSVRFMFTKRFALFWGMALLIFAPYVIYMSLRFGDFFDCYFIYCVFTRAAAPIEGHGGSPLFYLNYLATSENPFWTVLLPFAGGLCVFGAVVKRSKADSLLLIWMVGVLGLFSFAQTKLYWYVLPALPAFALAMGAFLYWLAEKAWRRRGRVKIAGKI